MLHYADTADYKRKRGRRWNAIGAAEVDARYFIHSVSIIVLRCGTALRYDAIYLSDSPHMSACTAPPALLLASIYLQDFKKNLFLEISYPKQLRWRLAINRVKKMKFLYRHYDGEQ